MSSSGLFTIPPGQSFADALIRGIVRQWHDDGDPFCLARITILLPTRRAVRTLRDGFRRWGEQAHGTPVLLPAIRPIGDADEDDLTLSGTLLDDLDLAPPIAPIRRQLHLAQLIQRWSAARSDRARALSMAQAVALAGDLGQFLDAVQTEEADLSGLSDLAPERFANHWQQTIDFLKILTDYWPAILAENGVSDPAARRSAILAAQAEAWRATPPKDPIIAAGSTGSIPATATLLSAILAAPQGAVVLPGLDHALDADSWEALDPSHPQFGLKHLLAHLSRERSDVLLWPGTEDRSDRNPRIRLINEALRPARTTHDWMTIKDGIAPTEATAGLSRIDAPTPAAESRTIAMIMRETVATPDATAALITPDRGLARRVVRDLRRWEIEVDDSAGMPLGLTPPAVFFRLIIDALAQDFAPIPLLSLLKHPLCRLGAKPDQHLSETALLERRVLRGLRPAPGLDGVRLAAAAQDDQTAETLNALIHRLEDALHPLTALARAGGDLGTFTAAHVDAAERAASLETSESDAAPDRLWIRDAGEALAAYCEELITGRPREPVPDRDGLCLSLHDLDGRAHGPPPERPPSSSAYLGPLGSAPATGGYHHSWRVE